MFGATGSSDGANDSQNSGIWRVISNSELVLFVSVERNAGCRQGFFPGTG